MIPAGLFRGLAATSLLWVAGAALGAGGLVVEPPPGLPPVPVPAHNPMTEAKVELGRRLFFDRKLSSDGTISCADCHRPDRAYADTVVLSQGVRGQLSPRNTPSLVNVAYRRQLMWDGRANSLEAQARYPLTHPREMAMTRARVEAVVRADAEYPQLFDAAFGTPRIDFDRVSWALASYQRTLVAADSPFDQYFFEGEATALTPAARRGWALFQGKAGCIRCHRFTAQAPFFSDGAYHNTGITWDRVELPDLGRYRHTRERDDKGRFRTPSLRNVALTAPYMHDGRFATLDDVVEFYVAGGIPNRFLDPLLEPLALTEEERRDLVRFLESLTSPQWIPSSPTPPILGATP